MNTMYAAVAYRWREIATLRVIGFSRPSILTSFVLSRCCCRCWGRRSESY